MRNAVAWLVVCCALQGTAFAQSAKEPVPISRIIAEQGCSKADLAPDVAGAYAASYLVLHDGKDCIIAFFRDLDYATGSLLEVISSRAPLYGWNHVSVPVDKGDRSPVASVQLEGELILINLSYSIDDYAIPILDSRLRYIGTIYGTFTKTWPNGLLEYSPHQPHFGPHDIEVGVFDPKSGTDRKIYPFTPCGQVRVDYVHRHRQFLGVNEDPTPEDCWAESRGLAPWYFDWRTNTFAFALELVYEYAEVGPWDQRATVMVTCEGLASIDTIKCRETPLEDWQRARPELSLTQLVTFAASQPRFR
jgi:hypothetical protein